MARRKSKERRDKRHSVPRTAAKAYGGYTMAALAASAGTSTVLARRAIRGKGSLSGAVRGGRAAGFSAGAAAGGALAYRGYRKRKRVKAGTLPRRKGRGGRQRRDSEGKFK
jgi:hypothetical protein